VKINNRILPSGRIGLAVSGGSDSVALALLLTKGGKKRNAAKRFVILHVDHGIRKESKEEYSFVRAFAKRLGVFVFIGNLELRNYNKLAPDGRRTFRNSRVP
jgi:tRNA(Ile)-lysidine synthase